MKKFVLVLALISVGCFAQEAPTLGRLQSEVSMARILCPGRGGADAAKRCIDESIEKTTGMYGEFKKQFSKNPAALAALKNYYAAAIAALQNTGTQNDRRIDDQTSLRLSELMVHLKIESGL